MYEQREKNDANNDVNVYSHDPQKCWKEKTNFSIMNVNKVDHPRVLNYNTNTQFLDHKIL